MNFQFNDGGRLEAGYKGTTGDCVCRAIAIVSGLNYQQVYDDLNELSKREHLTKRRKHKSCARNGVKRSTYDKYLTSLGFKWTPTMGVGTGCRVHLNEDELPDGKLIVRVSKHLTSVIDSVLNDTYDCSRNGRRCVYGYYSKSF